MKKNTHVYFMMLYLCVYASETLPLDKTTQSKENEKKDEKTKAL